MKSIDSLPPKERRTLNNFSLLVKDIHAEEILTLFYKHCKNKHNSNWFKYYLHNSLKKRLNKIRLIKK